MPNASNTHIFDPASGVNGAKALVAALLGPLFDDADDPFEVNIYDEHDGRIKAAAQFNTVPQDFLDRAHTLKPEFEFRGAPKSDEARTVHHFFFVRGNALLSLTLASAAFGAESYLGVTVDVPCRQSGLLSDAELVDRLRALAVESAWDSVSESMLFLNQFAALAGPAELVNRLLRGIDASCEGDSASERGGTFDVAWMITADACGEMPDPYLAAATEADLARRDQDAPHYFVVPHHAAPIREIDFESPGNCL